MLQALVASLRDELISDASIHQQQEVQMVMFMFFSLLPLLWQPAVTGANPGSETSFFMALVAHLCPASSDPADCLALATGSWGT